MATREERTRKTEHHYALLEYFSDVPNPMNCKIDITIKSQAVTRTLEDIEAPGMILQYLKIHLSKVLDNLDRLGKEN